MQQTNNTKNPEQGNNEFCTMPVYKSFSSETSLTIQWLRLCTSNAEGKS